jgi:ribose transport system permease protein
VSTRPETVVRVNPVASVGSGALRVLSVHGLLIIIGAVIAFFSLYPTTADRFLTTTNFQAIGNVRGPYAILALAFMVPLATNEFDLSIGYLAELGSILAIGFQVQSGLNWVLSCALVLLLGATVGLINGVLVTKFRVSSFIATLGVGTFLLGISTWYTGGRQISAPTYPHGFLVLSENVHGVPVVVLLAVGVGVVLWLAFEYRPVGRHLYVIGFSPRAAELIGVRIHRLKIVSFVVSGTLAAFAGILLGSQLQLGQLGISPALLLPAFAGALLGSTSVRPGRVNVWGTLLAIALLGITVAGLQQAGAAFYVEQLFNGGMLVVAVALAVFAARRRQAAVVAQAEKQWAILAEEPAVETSKRPEVTAE